MTVTITDIARAAGVGTSTVSRALRGQGYVSAAKKAQILRIAKMNGYQPNSVARALVTGQTQFVGFMVTFNLPALHTVIEPVERALREAGYPVLLHCPQDTPEAQAMCLDQFLQNRIAGLIAFPGVSTSDITPYQDLLDRGTKIVILDRRMDGLAVPQILVDGYRMSSLATEHLLSLGHRRIVHLAIPETSAAGRERGRGFRDAMARAGAPVASADVVPTQLTELDGFRAMAKVLRRKRRPTAVLARHDLTALGAMRAVFDAGLSVPEDISIMGVGDLWNTNVYKVPLTSVHYSAYNMARQGAKKLLDMLAGNEVKPDVTIADCSLMVRASTAPPKAE